MNLGAVNAGSAVPGAAALAGHASNTRHARHPGRQDGDGWSQAGSQSRPLERVQRDTGTKVLDDQEIDQSYNKNLFFSQPNFELITLSYDLFIDLKVFQFSAPKINILLCTLRLIWPAFYAFFVTYRILHFA